MYVKSLGWTVSCPLVPLIAKNFLSDPLSADNGEFLYFIGPSINGILQFHFRCAKSAGSNDVYKYILFYSPLAFVSNPNK